VIASVDLEGLLERPLPDFLRGFIEKNREKIIEIAKDLSQTLEELEKWGYDLDVEYNEETGRIEITAYRNVYYDNGYGNCQHLDVSIWGTIDDFENGSYHYSVDGYINEEEIDKDWDEFVKCPGDIREKCFNDEDFTDEDIARSGDCGYCAYLHAVREVLLALEEGYFP